MSSRGEAIRDLLREHRVELDASFGDDDSLIASGLLDSAALFQLVLWVEGEIGRPIDPGKVNIAREWDSISRILDYIDRALPTPAPSASPPPPPIPPRPPARTGRDALEVIPYTEAHKEQVAAFQKGLWSTSSRRNARYLQWKYVENPFAGEPRIYLAFQRGELVGMRGFYGSRWEAGLPATQHDILVADDLLVKERYRNQGLVHQIMQAAFEDLDARGEGFLFNLSGGPLTVLASLATGWKSAAHLYPVRRQTRESAQRSGIRIAIDDMPLLWRQSTHPVLFSHSERKPFLKIDRLMGDPIASHGATVRISAEPRPGPMAELVRRLGHDGRIRHLRDADFLKWRFRNPLNEYRFLYAGDETLEGYLVIKRRVAEGDPNPVVSIVDLEAADDSIRQALLETIAQPGLFENLYAWSITLHDADNTCLRNLGFTPADSRLALHGVPCILVHAAGAGRIPEPWSLSGKMLLEPQSWDMRMIYSMSG